MSAVNNRHVQGRASFSRIAPTSRTLRENRWRRRDIYIVSIAIQPRGQTRTVANANHTMDPLPIGNIDVTCHAGTS